MELTQEQEGEMADLATRWNNILEAIYVKQLQTEIANIRIKIQRLDGDRKRTYEHIAAHLLSQIENTLPEFTQLDDSNN